VGDPFLSTQTTVLQSIRNVGGEGVPTTGSFDVQHKYAGPPNPGDPTAKIPITVTIVDDNLGATDPAMIKISNPGIQVINVAIDTTPQVPRLVFTQQQVAQVLLNQGTNTPQSLQVVDTRVVSNELAATSDRYLELDVISPDGKITQRYRLKDEALADLRGLIATLPDNHYKIFLVRTDNDSRRLVLDVFVRRGRVVDPSDQSEGTRDRPPEVLPQNQAQPLENNPQLEQVPEQTPPAAMNVPGAPSEQISAESTPPRIDDQPAPVAEGPSSSRLRWAASLAGVGVIGQRGNWARDLDDAFDRADERAWQRLRRAGHRRVSK
ncbi:MAG TPA: hypothetical protein VHU84_05695, partial [Lacipirellulaceae bacterium]|nr:hypothetical protein [Lacipirellulaceae bacterium]